MLAAAALGFWRDLDFPRDTPQLIPVPLAASLAVHVASATLLLRRRQHPETVAFAIAGPALLTPTYAALVVPYSVAMHAQNRHRLWLPVLAVIAGWMLGARVWEQADRFSAGLLMLGLTVLGLYLRARRTLVQALTERADKAEREQEYLAEQARADERARLAGEMHDVVTHRVNLMVLQAGALQMSSADESVRRAAENLREAGSQALDELRDLVGVLRFGRANPAIDASPEPVGDLAALVDESRSVGLAVELTEDGDPSSISPTVRRTAYRVVQESLTNVRKHAPGASTTVVLRYGPDRVRAIVHNSAPTQPADHGLTATGGGSGLFGLRQRVELVSGTLAAGAVDGGGFQVDAVLPAFVPTGTPPAR